MSRRGRGAVHTSAARRHAWPWRRGRGRPRSTRGGRGRLGGGGCHRLGGRGWRGLGGWRGGRLGGGLGGGGLGLGFRLGGGGFLAGGPLCALLRGRTLRGRLFR